MERTPCPPNPAMSISQVIVYVFLNCYYGLLRSPSGKVLTEKSEIYLLASTGVIFQLVGQAHIISTTEVPLRCRE